MPLPTSRFQPPVHPETQIPPERFATRRIYLLLPRALCYQGEILVARRCAVPRSSCRACLMKYLLAFLAGFVLANGVLAAEPAVVEVRADPPQLALRGPEAVFQMLVHGKTSAGRQVDLTHRAHYRILDAQVARVSASGVVQAAKDGRTQLEILVAGRTILIPVSVTGTRAARTFHFENDISPLLSRHSCNSSGCHGKAEGQNGFKLSVFGFDPEADHAALVKEARGRRIVPAAPDQSLFLRKAAGLMAHGGGTRMRRDSRDYQTLRAWIQAGAPLGQGPAPQVTTLRVEPQERVLSMKDTQQLRVMATLSDGRVLDVTAHARFQTNNDALASVDAEGLVRVGETPGDVAIMASYRDQVEVCRILVPRSERLASAPKLAENNFIDHLVFARLRKLNLLPSELCDDATYLRRVFLDLLGTLPTASETRAFLNDPRSDKRARLVDTLLQRPEFADYWALQWADPLRVDRQVLGHKQAFAYYRWIRESFATNKPLDQFARELLTAEGPLAEAPAGNFYKVLNKPGEAASAVAQVFLGVRIACAQCHHHPYDRWSQDDYQGMLAFFSQVSLRKDGEGEVLYAEGNPVVHHPRTGAVLHAHVLGTKNPADSPPGDRRLTLARWLTSRDNPFFARHLANRTWAHLLGRGLVEPVDDVRATNPPSNPELLDALAGYLVEHNYDLRALIRTITASRVYQLSTTPNATNERDEQNYSRALLRRVEAEVLLDMVCQTTGVPEKFEGVPLGARAIQLWDSKVNHYFLKVFGRPMRLTACVCERNHEPSVSQILHLLNSPKIQGKLGHASGQVRKLVRQYPDDAALIDALYLTFYSRLPQARERDIALVHFRKAKSRQEGAEDLAWALLNSLEFVFNH